MDVSGSMKKAFALDSSKDTSVERVHTILTTVLKIVKAELNHHDRSDEIFVSVFGLKAGVDICDLIALLHLIAGPEELRRLQPHDALVELAKEHGAAHAEQWIRLHLNKEDARELHRVLCFDTTLVSQLVHAIPPESTSSGRLAVFRKHLPGAWEICRGGCCTSNRSLPLGSTAYSRQG